MVTIVLISGLLLFLITSGAGTFISCGTMGAFAGGCVLLETVEKARTARSDHVPLSAAPGAPLHRAFCFLSDSAGWTMAGAAIDPAGFIDFPKFLPILQRIEAGGQSGPALLGRDDHALFRSVLRPK